MKALFVTVIAMVSVCDAAHALTLDEMQKPTSAIWWRETDVDMRRMDIRDYLASLHKQQEPTEEQVTKVENCLYSKMREYERMNIDEKNGPSLINLMKKCNVK